MATEDKTGQILVLLNELITLVKASQPKVENHTHHHYPTNPQYHFPNQWTYGTNTTVPGMTTTWSTNDPSTPPGFQNDTNSNSE